MQKISPEMSGDMENIEWKDCCHPDSGCSNPTNHMENTKKPRPLSLVRFKRNHRSEEDEQKYYLSLLDRWFIYLGDIPNQPGHCVLINAGGAPGHPEHNHEQRTLELFRHTGDFEEVPEGEV